MDRYSEPLKCGLPDFQQQLEDGASNIAANKSNDICKWTNPLQSGRNSLKKELSVTESGNHTDDKLFSCFFCEKKFVTGGLLTLHTSVHTGEKLLSCIICKRTFGLESELRSHLCAVETSQDHQSQADDQTSKQVNCSQCSEAFSSCEDLNVHLRCHTRGDTFRCSVCSACCSDRDSLIQHMRIHTRQTQFTCSVCGKDFAWRRHLTKHMEVHKKKKKVFRCRICAAEFYTYYLLSKHKPIHQSSEFSHSQENGLIETAADGEDCSGPESLKSNPDTCLKAETDVGTVPFKTEEQDFWEETKEPQSDFTSVGKYEMFESETKSNIQQLTDGEGPSHTELQKVVKQEDPEPPHIKEEPEENEITEFSVISFTVKTEDEEEKPKPSELHRQTEENRNCVEEPDPDKNGTTSDSSDPDTDDSDCWKQKRKPQSGSHSESDSGRNPFSCSDNRPSESLHPESDDSVDSDFWKDDRKPQTSLNSLKQEVSEVGVKYVTDLKPYSCIQCSKAFRYSSYLKIHMKQHTEKYFCSVCGHKSTSSSNLKVHMRTHTGEKPFSCQICDKKYTNKASLQSHMTLHTAERKYSCDVCKKSFAWYTELKYHKCVGESSHEQMYEENTGINLKRHTSYS
ncbi:zinc finger protein 431-like [Cololabis saira]|uniref:zinc finger protein 431-like n=1 Tax=Cololabis saira TaxID=129043 RepID=UPI002AD20053|nr:zinc finger protein 431-like [Cololabis saira]